MAACCKASAWSSSGSDRRESRGVGRRAAILGVNLRAVYYSIRSRECPSAHVGRRVEILVRTTCWCGRVFYGGRPDKVYCSQTCRGQAREARRDRARDRAPRPCDACGDQFTPPLSDGRFCSSACRQPAYRLCRRMHEHKLDSGASSAGP